MILLWTKGAKRGRGKWEVTFTITESNQEWRFICFFIHSSIRAVEMRCGALWGIEGDGDTKEQGGVVCSRRSGW